MIADFIHLHWGSFASAAFFLAFVASLYLVPNMVANRHSAQGSWRQKRSHGYNLLAERAREKSLYPLACLCARLAVRTNRHSPDNLLLHAGLVEDLGDNEASLALRHQAHRLMTRGRLSDPDVTAENAYEAACAAGRLGRKDVALQWLKVSISYQPNLAYEARWEPDLGLVSQEIAFKTMAGESVSVDLEQATQ